MQYLTVNLEAGHPTVEMARTHLNMAIRSAKANGTRVLKLIHGYGSSGKGGSIRSDVQAQLRRKKQGSSFSGSADTPLCVTTQYTVIG
mgnify:CR=1 FL=1